MTLSGRMRTGGRRPRSVRSTLAAIVLATELVVVFLSALVVFGLHDLPAGEALGGGGALLVLIVIAAATATRRFGIVLGWIIQIALVAVLHVDLAVGIVGVIFAAFWVYCMIVGGRIDRREAQA